MAKGVAYALCLGCGFRGGPIFPALVIGVALGAASADLPGGLALTPAVAACAAAACAAQMRLAISSTLLAIIVVGSAGFAAVSIAALGAVIGYLVRLAADGRDDEGAAPAHAPVAAST